MLGERFGERAAALDIRLGRENELLHRGVVVTRADDFESLNQRDAGLEHDRELPREYRDIARRDLAAAGKKPLGLLANPQRDHALPA